MARAAEVDAHACKPVIACLTRVVAWTAARVLMSDAITLDMVAVKALVRMMMSALSKGLQGRQDMGVLH